MLNVSFHSKKWSTFERGKCQDISKISSQFVTWWVFKTIKNNVSGCRCCFYNPKRKWQLGAGGNILFEKLIIVDCHFAAASRAVR